MIGYCHVVRPDIILPLHEAQDPAMHFANVHSHAHVQVHFSSFSDRPERTQKGVGMLGSITLEVSESSHLIGLLQQLVT